MKVEWRKVNILAEVLIVFGIIGLASSSFSGETSTVTNDYCPRLVADVRMSADPSVAVRVDGLSDRVSRMEVNQAVCEGKQNECLRKLEASLSNLVDSRVDRRCEKKLGDLKQLADGFYETRYRGLKETHDQFVDRLGNWLTLIGILVAVLGFGVPLIISILQKCEVKKWLHQARADVRKEIFVSRKAKKREIDLLRRDSLKALHMLVSENFAIVDLLGNGTTVDKTVLLSSAIVCIHELLECAMRTRDAKCVAAEIAAVRPFVGRWTKPDDGAPKKIWDSACRCVKSAITESEDACRRIDYDQVLNCDSENFKWLEEFYKNFANWKFA